MDHIERATTLPRYLPGIEAEQLDPLERQRVRELLQQVAPTVFELRLGTRLFDSELPALAEAFFSRFDNATSIDKLLDLGPDRKEEIALALSSLLAWFYDRSTPSRPPYSESWWDYKRGRFDERAASHRDAAESARELLDDAPDEEADALRAEAEEHEYRAQESEDAADRAQRFRKLGSHLVRQDVPRAGAPLARDTLMLVALSKALVGVPLRWKLIAGLVNEFLDRDYHPEQCRMRCVSADERHRERVRRRNP